jgi:hypothetical protein
MNNHRGVQADFTRGVFDRARTRVMFGIKNFLSILACFAKQSSILQEQKIQFFENDNQREIQKMLSDELRTLENMAIRKVGESP